MTTDEVDGAELGLPTSAGPLIGRASEVALIRQQLMDGRVRLLTLCGVGGIGKTRLAIEVARTAGRDFTHGARLVELAPFREPALVLSAIATSVQANYPGSRPAIDALKRSLQKLHLLLVLDNFEQVLAAAPLVSELLADCPTLTVLATSRAPLGLTWEREIAIGPLEVPRAELDQRPEALLAIPSVALLLERMARVGVVGSRDPAELVAIAAICRRLDGIPLAIELAAARSKVLSPSALLARLEHPIELLSGGPRDTPARHQALRATFDWSYELLVESDQRLFRTLGAFVGGCTFEAAARVSDVSTADTEIGFIDALGRLVDSGLICRVDHAAASEPRLSLLEPVREYALERLQACGEQEAVLQRHATTYLELAELADPYMRGPNEREWLARLEHEHGNSLVALRWFVDHGDAERSLRLASALCMFWWVRGFIREGLERLKEALALPVPEPPNPSIALARAHALSMAGAAVFWQGDYAAAAAHEHAALELYADTGDAGRRAFALITLGSSALVLGDVDRAELLYDECLELYRAAADQRGIAQATNSLGLVAFHRANYDQAYTLLTAGVSGLRAVGDMRGAAYGLRTLATLHCYQGDFDAAQACAREGLSLWRDAGGRVLLPSLLEASAIVAVATGDHMRGLTVAAAAAAMREKMDTPQPPAWMRHLKGWLDRAVGAVGPEASSTARSDGLALSMEDAVATALAANRTTGVAVGLNGSNASNRLSEIPVGVELSRRETEVLRMVASGYTNKEIASQLSLSVATVERHVANVYAKIGARGRAQATAFAITRGLTAPGRE